jgi:hypothetical protein
MYVAEQQKFHLAIPLAEEPFDELGHPQAQLARIAAFGIIQDQNVH